MPSAPVLVLDGSSAHTNAMNGWRAGFIAGILAFSTFACAQHSQQRALPSPTPLQYTYACLPHSVNLRDLQPLRLGPAQIRSYLDSYDSLGVRGLRTALDADAAHQADKDTTSSIAPYKNDLLRHRFVVMALVNNPFGGSTIEFQDPKTFSALYRAWVYTLADGTPTIRTISRTSCTPAERRWLVARYGAIAGLGDDSTLITKAAPVPVATAQPVAATTQQPRAAIVSGSSTPLSREAVHAPAPPQSMGAPSEADCEDVSVYDIYDDGAIVELLDGRRFHVSDADQTTSDVWVPPFDGLICGTKLINKDEDDSVELTPD